MQPKQLDPAIAAVLAEFPEAARNSLRVKQLLADHAATIARLEAELSDDFLPKQRGANAGYRYSTYTQK